MSFSPAVPLDFGPGAGVITKVAASADYGLRTLAATIVAASMVPMALGSSLTEDLEKLDTYIGLATRGDAKKTFPAPKGVPDVTAVRQVPLVGRPRAGRIDVLSWPTRSTPLFPDDTITDGPNATAWAQHWRHADGPRPTLLVAHGFMASPYWANSAFFSLPWFYRQGYDVVLLTLPFHGARTAPGAYSGGGLFAGGIAHLIEAMRQAVHDIRSLVRWLEAEGAPSIGMTGLSLGGLTTALLAEAEPKLAFAIPNCPPVDLGQTGEQWFPASVLLKVGSRFRGMDRERYMAAVRAVSPLTYPAAIAKDRLFVIAGLGDRLVMPEDPEALWEHWGRPKIHWFPGNHTLHVNRAAYLRRMKEFLATKGFVPEAAEDVA